jgi:hypothetical protein
MVPVTPKAKPALSKRCVLLPYKTRNDLICNGSWGEISDIWG